MTQPKLRSLIFLLFHIALISPLFCLCTAGLLFAAEPVSTKAPKKVCIQPLDGIPLELTANEEAEVDKMVLPVPKDWIGDFDGIRKRRYIRILVPNSKTFFSVDRGVQQGIEYEFGMALEKWINQKYPSEKKSRQLHVFFIPVKRDQLLPYLLAGKGDVAAGGLTITPGRKQMVDFTIPMTTGVREALVTGLDYPNVNKLEDLSGKVITVRASSSYYEHLVNINARLGEQGLPPIKMITAADEWLESEDLLEMVNAGCIQATVVDRYLAQIWQPLLNNMKIEDNFYINDASDMAWAIRKGSPKLEAILNSFMNQHKVGTLFGNIVVNRYVKDSNRVVNETSTKEIRKFTQLVSLFKSHGQNYGFDYLMLMAQGYQESMLNQKATSPKGAVGIMQLLPTTATDPAINIRGVANDPDKNIEAAAKYLRLLTDKYLNDKELTPVNKTLMAFAAYNAGPGNLRKFRRLAEKSGRDPNIWFQNVEYAAARIIGKETVNYVANIYKYYLAYKLINEKDRYSKAKELTLAN